MKRETSLIKSGIAQADTGQTTQTRTPRWARSAVFQLSVVTLAGTTRTIDYKLRPVARKITAAPSIATTVAGVDGVTNEVQTITLTGGPTGGTFTITWTGISADISATTEAISATATAGEVNLALRKALGSGVYQGHDIVDVRTGSGTSAAPYIHTLTFSGPTVDKLDVDAVTASGLNLYTESTISVDYMGWDGITQLTAVGDVFVHVGPHESDTADDTGTIYQLQSELPEMLAHVITLDRTDTDETYTYSLYATYTG